MIPTYENLQHQFAPVGMVARGGFHPQPSDALPDINGRPVQTLILLGFTGTQNWPTFASSAEYRDGLANPLDRWSMRVIDALAHELEGRAFYPSDGPPWWPFQRWARRALTLHVSPLGVLIDPRFGLWHSYRGALALPVEIDLPAPVSWPNPCASCESKPCLNTCPVGAVQPGAYGVDACRSYVRTTDTCRRGCLARRACPVGAEHAYTSTQASFYMRAFAGADSVDIQVENPNQPEVIALLEASDAYMAQLYPAESNHLLDVRSLSRPEVTFLVARIDGRAMGCGALVASAHGWAELKRMFVSPAARGNHIGRRLLQQLEAAAAQHGVATLRLETGTQQPEALALYRSAGFSEIGPFGDYRPDPLSLFMEKRLPSPGLPSPK